MITRNNVEIEVWKPIPSLEGYEASSWGRIRAPERLVPCAPWTGGENFRCIPGGILTLRDSSNKYPYKVFSSRGKTKLVNRVVCEAFHGQPPTDKHQAAHLDGKPANNRPENLIWATQKENESHKVWHGTDSVGSRNAAAIFSEKDIPRIFDMFLAGKSYLQIGATFDADFSHIGSIIRRELWPHVKIKPGVMKAVNELLKKKRAMGLENGRKIRSECAVLKNRVLICRHCGIEFRTRNQLQDTRQFCVAACYWASKKGKKCLNLKNGR